jgi:hypothetical protein
MTGTITFAQFMQTQAKTYQLDYVYEGTKIEYDASWDGHRLKVGCDKLADAAPSWVLSNPVMGLGKFPLREALLFNRSALKYLRAGLITEDGLQYKLLWRVPSIEQLPTKWEQDMKTYVALLTRARRLFKEAPNPCEIYAH